MEKIKRLLSKFFTSRQFRYGSNSVIMTIAFIGILVVLNIFVSSQNWKLDLSRDKKFTLSKETTDYLKTVKKEVRVIAFYDMGNEQEDVKNTLNDYKKHFPGLKIEFVDPDQSPALARKYMKDEAGIAPGTIVVESGQKFRKLNEYDLYDRDYQTGELRASRLEQKLTGAISYVTSEKDPVIYLLGGHGEMGLDKSTVVRNAIEDVNYVIKDFDLVTSGSVPEDADIVAIIAPQKDLSTGEMEKLDRYLDGGGRMMLFLEPFVELPNLAGILNKYNIGADNNFVIETDPSRVVFNYPLYLKPVLQQSDLTSSIANKNLNIIFPEARSLHQLKNEKEGLTIQSLAKTTDKSWGETNFKDQSPKKDADDVAGPLDLAFSVEYKSTSGAGQDTRMVVFGDATFLTDEAFMKLGAVGNYDLFANTLAWLGERNDAVIIGTKYITSERLQLNSFSQMLTAMLVVALLPIMAIIAGITVWARRRHL